MGEERWRCALLSTDVPGSLVAQCGWLVAVLMDKTLVEQPEHIRGDLEIPEDSTWVEERNWIRRSGRGFEWRPSEA